MARVANPAYMNTVTCEASQQERGIIGCVAKNYADMRSSNQCHTIFVFLIGVRV